MTCLDIQAIFNGGKARHGKANAKLWPGRLQHLVSATQNLSAIACIDPVAGLLSRLALPFSKVVVFLQGRAGLVRVKSSGRMLDVSIRLCLVVVVVVVMLYKPWYVDYVQAGITLFPTDIARSHYRHLVALGGGAAGYYVQVWRWSIINPNPPNHIRSLLIISRNMLYYCQTKANSCKSFIEPHRLLSGEWRLCW